MDTDGGGRFRRNTVGDDEQENAFQVRCRGSGFRFFWFQISGFGVQQATHRLATNTTARQRSRRERTTKSSRLVATKSRYKIARQSRASNSDEFCKIRSNWREVQRRAYCSRFTFRHQAKRALGFRLFWEMQRRVCITVRAKIDRAYTILPPVREVQRRVYRKVQHLQYATGQGETEERKVTEKVRERPRTCLISYRFFVVEHRFGSPQGGTPTRDQRQNEKWKTHEK